MAKALSLLLVGATGAVGQALLRQALAEKRITRIVAPTRRPLGGEFAGQARLLNPVIAFDPLPDDAPWWKVDAVACTLGSTIKVAGSEAAFAAIDRDLPIAVGRLAYQAGATGYALNSSLGASVLRELSLQWGPMPRAEGQAVFDFLRANQVWAYLPPTGALVAVGNLGNPELVAADHRNVTVAIDVALLTWTGP